MLRSETYGLQPVPFKERVLPIRRRRLPSVGHGRPGVGSASFRARRPPSLSRQVRDLLKIKVLLSDSSPEKRPHSSVFHGKFFRSSWATANLTGAKLASCGIYFPGIGADLR